VTRFLAQPARGSLCGVWLSMASTPVSEIIAGAGFDWVLIDGEHGPNTIQTVLDQVRAMAPFPTEVIVRPLNHDPAVVKQYLDIGISTFLMPAVESADQATSLVAATRYPPAGVRGVAGAITRASGYGHVLDYLSNADAGVCVIAQIETPAGVRHAESIAAVDGIDGLFVGPADLAATLGHRGDPKHPDVRAAAEKVLNAARRVGRATGIFGMGRPDANQWINDRVDMVAVGSDVGLLASAARELSQAFAPVSGKDAGL